MVDSSVVDETDATTLYNIRAMVAADIPEVLRIERSSYQIPWTEQIFRDCLKVGYYCLVMQNNQTDRLLGYIFFSAAVGESHVLNLCVDKTHRRGGFAEALLFQAIATVITVGARVMFLEVRESNAGAIALYEKTGFIETGRRENYYNAVATKPGQSTREDALLMAKELVF